jgi:hypothetical protein
MLARTVYPSASNTQPAMWIFHHKADARRRRQARRARMDMPRSDIPRIRRGGATPAELRRARRHWHRYMFGLKEAREKTRFVPPQLQHWPVRLVVLNFVQVASQLPVLVPPLVFKPYVGSTVTFPPYSTAKFKTSLLG